VFHSLLIKFTKLSNKIDYLLLFTYLAFVSFTFFGWKNLDPDFGWHYRMGEIIQTQGIPKTDPFTFTMPSYPFVDYEWLSNVFIFQIYSRYGKLVLASLYALIAVLAMRIVIPGRHKSYALFLSLLGWSVMFPRSGIRPQVEGWLLLAILIRMLLNKKKWERWRWLFPLLILIWVNLHGSYPFAFLIVGAVKFGEFLQCRKIDWKDILVVLLGLGATFINPYGINDWLEVLKQMNQTGFFRQTISEWQPFYAKLDLGLLFVFVLSGLFFLKFKIKKNWSWFFVFVLTGYMAISSIRHAPLFILCITPFICYSLYKLQKEASNIPFGAKRFLSVQKLFCILGALIFMGEGYVSMRSVLNENNFYPASAIDYMKDKPLNGQMFNVYGWGGYSIWKLPEKKVFVDGRMSGFLWKAPEGESDSAFRDYLTVTSGDNGWESILNKYNVGHILWYSDEKTDSSQIALFIEKWIALLTGKPNNIEIPLVDRLKNLGWREIYRDKVAVIIERP
jgi:hypothetical protein